MEETTSTKSCILVHMREAPEQFITWIKEWMENNNLGIRDVAKEWGLSHPTVSDIVTLGKAPSFETCMILANYFNKSPIWILELAGLLPPQSKNEPRIEELIHIFKQLDEKDKIELLRFAEMKLQLKLDFNQPDSLQGRLADLPIGDKSQEMAVALNWLREQGGYKISPARPDKLGADQPG